MFDEIDVEKLYEPEQIIKTLTTREYKEKYVNFDATIKACMECPNYSKNWGCPEFTGDEINSWDKYDNIELVLTKINFTSEALQNSYSMEEIGYIVDNSLFKEKAKLMSFLEEEEKNKNGKYLSAGYCKICDTCSRIESKECRFPEKCRNSIESIGGLVGDTLEGVFNEEMKWIDTENGKLPENLSLLMGVLY